MKSGDRAALQTVYRLTSAKLFGVALRILGERSEAEDILQEVYVTVRRKAADFDASRASPMTWLIALARNRSIDRLRASRVSRNMDPIDSATEVADMAAAADTALESVQEHARLHGCLDGLVSHERAALRGAFFDGNTYATRVPELWLIPPDGRPRAAGLLHADQTVVLTLPPELAALAKNNAVLAVSLEPPGGSTTGLPTGPVIATGKLTSL